MNKPDVMKWQKIFIFILLSFTSLLTSGCIKELHYSLAIHPDGSGSLSQRVLLDRKTVEQSFALRNQNEYDGPAPQKTSFSEEELEENIRTSFEAKSNGMLAGSELDSGIESLEIGPEVIDLVISSSSPDLATLVESTYFLWEELENPLMTLEKNPDQQLELALKARVDELYMEQWIRRYAQMFSSMQIKFSLTVQMPGKIISSNLETNAENTSSLSISSWDKDSIALFHQLLNKGIRVVSETGGLTLPDTPLNSDELLHRAWDEQQTELEQFLPPITDAQPGYLPVALNSQTIRTKHFREAINIFSDKIVSHLPQKETTEIRGRLFLPKNRILHSTGELLLISAKDDHGRDIQVPEQATGENSPATFVGDYNNSTTDVGYCNFTIQLVAPPKDCRAIEDIRLEGVVTTFSGWEKQEISNLAVKQGQPIDLSSLLPGTRLIIQEMKVQSVREGNLIGTVELELSGPPEIARLSYLIGQEKGTHLYTEEIERKSNTVDGVMTQKTTLQYQRESSSENDRDNILLIVRFPRDMKREKVVLELHDLDLY